jgi:hypothetical protein
MRLPLYFHEDDYCQIELLPAREAPRCAAQMTEIDSFSTAHQTGAGWTEMYVRSEPDLPPLATLQQSVRVWVDAIQTHSPAVFHPQVSTGYSSYSTLAPTCVGWAVPDGVWLFVELAEDTVQRAWLLFNDLKKAGVAGSQAALRCLTESHELIIADWEQCELVAVNDAAQLLTYLQSQTRQGL